MANESLILKIGADVSSLKGEFAKIDRTMNDFRAGIGKVGGLLAGAFAIGGIAEVGKEIVNVTSEFQKFSAVLTNTLGSKSAAQVAMFEIQEFASKTPFSVQQLTESFVKLANQGFKPTTKELTKLGDLASAMGKDFNQLTEAIIDAQTGEFERLKEFGIRASKEGDRVTFTFKGVKQQVDFTADSIRQYILSLGELQGVSGGMAAISETLGGKISNLGDAWDNFLRTVGDGNNGILSGTVTLLSQAVAKATELLRTDAQTRGDEQSNAYKTQYDNVVKIYDTVKDIDKVQEAGLRSVADEMARINRELELGDAAVKKLNETPWYESKTKDKSLFNQVQRFQQERNDLVNKYNDLQNEGNKGVLEAIASLREQVRLENERAKAAQSAYNTKVLEERLERFKQKARLTETGRIQDLSPMTKVNDMSVNPLNQMAVNFEAIEERMRNATISMTENLRTFTNTVVLDIAPILNEAMMSIAVGIGSALGDLATGVGSAEQRAAAGLEVMAGIMMQLGQLAIAGGLAKMAIDKAMVTFMGGGGAVAAGIALVALSKAMSNKAAAIAKGGGGSGMGGGATGSASSRNGFVTDQLGDRIVLSGEFMLKGSTVVALIDNQNRVDNRTKF